MGLRDCDVICRRHFLKFLSEIFYSSSLQYKISGENETGSFSSDRRFEMITVVVLLSSVFDNFHHLVSFLPFYQFKFLPFGLHLRKAPCTISISVTDNPRTNPYCTARFCDTSPDFGTQPARSLCRKRKHQFF